MKGCENNMDKPVYTITSHRDERVFIHAMPGHYISASSHINYYIGTSDIKHNHDVSVDAAMLLAQYYNERSIKVDTVLCLYETQALGAYLAHELSRPNMLNPNPENKVYVLGSEYDSAGNLIFRDNLKKLISSKDVVILISCITSGKTVERAIESISYYGGRVVGISSVFSAIVKVEDMEINTIFNKDDVPGYAAYTPHNCPHCAAGEKVDAIANGYGYSLL